MILDEITNIEKYSNFPELKAAISYILSNNLTALKEGKYEIDGENLYVNIAEFTGKEEEEVQHIMVP